jgi:DNA modification methylase
MAFEIKHADCLEAMRGMADNSVDSIVTDPPYGLSFMGKKWDYDVPEQAVWEECLRVLKPGGHLLAFAGTRTQHRMAVRIEDAGFEIRDMIAWVYGSGFPKSLDVSKALDKAAGAEREAVGFDAEKAKQQTRAVGTASYGDYAGNAGVITDPATEAARQWQGWGTALKPAMEPITVARKPLIGTVAANVLEHGTGALNIDGCRVPIDQDADASQLRTMQRSKRDADDGWGMSSVHGDTPSVVRTDGRWPANLIHDGSADVVSMFPQSAGQQGDVRGTEPSSVTNGIYGDFAGRFASPARNDTGSAARFFYCAKASKADRDEGLDHMAKDVVRVTNTGHTGNPSARNGERTFNPRANNHPTVKPTALMRYLCRLVTPQSGTVLDPFMGSGSTGKAAVLEGFEFIGIEREAEYVAIAEARIVEAQRSLGLFA